MWKEISKEAFDGNIRSLARCISLIENKVRGYDKILESLPYSTTPVIGITGPPGAGKSTLTDALIHEAVADGKRVAVLCIDPSSPFTKGSVLGDRIRMSRWYNHSEVFIRSLSSRGAMGGLSTMTIEITDLLKASGFDLIFIETVGIGQNELDIAGLADYCIVVLVPEAGDDVQAMKSGMMEIADLFVVNKSDREGATTFAANLIKSFTADKRIPVLMATATKSEGTAAIYKEAIQHLQSENRAPKKLWLLAEKAYRIISENKMQGISIESLHREISKQIDGNEFNLYRFITSKSKGEK